MPPLQSAVPLPQLDGNVATTYNLLWGTALDPGLLELLMGTTMFVFPGMQQGVRLMKRVLSSIEPPLWPPPPQLPRSSQHSTPFQNQVFNPSAYGGYFIGKP